MSGEADSLYRDALHYDLLAQMTAPADLDFYRLLLGERPGSVLELGSGTGRLSIPLARETSRMVGVERVPEMLERARGKALLAGSDVEFRLGDMRRLALRERFDWVLLPYNTLNHMTGPDDPADLLAGVADHLGRGGRFVIDTFQPDADALARAPRWTRLLRYIDPHDGERVEMFELSRFDPASRVCHVRLRFDRANQPGWREDTLALRIFYPAELEGLLQRHGFALDARFGDYDRSGFGPRSPKQLIVATRARPGSTTERG